LRHILATGDIRARDPLFAGKLHSANFASFTGCANSAAFKSKSKSQRMSVVRFLKALSARIARRRLARRAPGLMHSLRRYSF
jgi:hypothetical protein